MIRFIFILLFFTSYLFAERQDSVGLIKINGKFHVRYMVSPGETVYRISSRYKVSVSDLMEINPELENGLKTGQILNIPYTESVVESKSVEKAQVVYPKSEPKSVDPILPDDSLTENGVVHTIRVGETYSSLASKYQISVDEFLKINQMELKPGQKVIVNTKLKARTSSGSKVQENASSIAAQSKTTGKGQMKPVEIDKSSDKTQANTVDNAAQTAPKVQVAMAQNGVSDENNDDKLIAEEYSNKKKNLLVIPFDPYLYFSDADDEIASVSKIQRTKVRQSFRRRLNALLEPKGYETIHLLGGKAKDSITDLNKIYSSVNYSYQDLLNNSATRTDEGSKSTSKQSAINIGDNSRAAQAQDSKKYFGVRISNPDFFTFFNNKYHIDYYLFVNQFEVKTNYENCLDRATMNYERGFTVHYSIFDRSGKQIAGNRIYLDYNSNTNNISKILSDNMQKAADKIMADLPPAP